MEDIYQERKLNKILDIFYKRAVQLFLSEWLVGWMVGLVAFLVRVWGGFYLFADWPEIPIYQLRQYCDSELIWFLFFEMLLLSFLMALLWGFLKNTHMIRYLKKNDNAIIHQLSEDLKDEVEVYSGCEYTKEFKKPLGFFFTKNYVIIFKHNTAMFRPIQKTRLDQVKVSRSKYYSDNREIKWLVGIEYHDILGKPQNYIFYLIQDSDSYAIIHGLRTYARNYEFDPTRFKLLEDEEPEMMEKILGKEIRKVKSSSKVNSQ